MNNLNELLATTANESIAHSDTKLEQKASRALKSNTMNALQDLLSNALEGNDSVALFRTADGIAIRIDNESTGFITITLDATIKQLDYDADFEAEDFANEAKAKAEKAAALAKAREAKKAHDAAERAAKLAARKKGEAK